MNIGFLEVNKKYGPFDCYIFHDVDIILEDDRSIYSCFFSPLHLGAFCSDYFYKLKLPKIMGGIAALTPEHFVAVNGYSNQFFGWGGEDDEFYLRVTETYKFKVTRYPEFISHLHVIQHARDEGNGSGEFKNEGTFLHNETYTDQHGLNQTAYKVLSHTLYPLYTHIRVDIEPFRCPSCRYKNGTYLNCYLKEYISQNKLACCNIKNGMPSEPYCCKEKLY